MPMVIDELVKRPGLWLSPEQSAGIVISSRVRLARNVRGHAFPEWAEDPERRELCQQLRDALTSVRSLADASFVDMEALDDVDTDVLRERHLISSELAEGDAGSGLVVAGDERIAVMINEEDHLRLQAITPGMNLPAVWEKIDAVDTDLESRVAYAFSPTLGYLTACPTNVGTGLRASVMMHLSGLRLANDAEAVIRGLERIGFTVRGLLGEGTEAYGNMFQISNQSTLGETEEAIIERLTGIASLLACHEQNARERLMEDRRIYVADQIARAFGVLMNARLLSSKEAVDLLSGLRLGVELGLVSGLTLGRINEIMLLTQPGHLQKMTGRVIDSDERDEVRAGIVRRRLKGVSIKS